MNAFESFLPPNLENHVFIQQIDQKRPNIWLGSDTRTNENVLIKLCSKKDASPKILSLISNEIALLKRVNHPQIAKLHDVFEDSKFFYIIVDHPKSMTLKQYITKKGPMSEQEAQKFFASLASIFSYLESIYKRSSLTLTANSVYVSTAGDIEQVYVSYYTIEDNSNYKAPEVITEQSTGPPTDVWLCGIFLYYVVTGHLPFESENNENLVKLILHAQPDCTGIEPDTLRQFLLKLLAKNPVTRITFSIAANHPWIKAANSDVLSSMEHFTQTKKPRCQTMLIASETSLLRFSRQRRPGESETDDENVQTVANQSKQITSSQSSSRLCPQNNRVRLTPKKVFVQLGGRSKLSNSSIKSSFTDLKNSNTQ